MSLHEDHMPVVEAMRFRLTTRRSGSDVYVIGVEGELDMFRTPALKDLFLNLVARGPRAVVVDLSQTSLLDSTALALLMMLPRQINRDGLVVIACNNPQIRKTLEITGADRRLTLASGVEHALDRLEQELPPAA